MNGKGLPDLKWEHRDTWKKTFTCVFQSQEDAMSILIAAKRHLITVVFL